MWIVLAVLACPAWAPAATPVPLAAATPVPPASPPDPVAACQNAVRQALASRPNPPGEVGFDAAPAPQPELSSESQQVLRGAGKLKGTRGATASTPFTFSCTVDAHSASIVGVALRDAASASAPAAPPPVRARVEPDLSRFSPVDCESATAEALKQRWPKVSLISFDSATRSFAQENDSKAELRGQGTAMPMPGSPHMHFGFECQLDPRDGKVLGLRLSG